MYIYIYIYKYSIGRRIGSAAGRPPDPPAGSDRSLQKGIVIPIMMTIITIIIILSLSLLPIIMIRNSRDCCHAATQGEASVRDEDPQRQRG